MAGLNGRLSGPAALAATRVPARQAGIGRAQARSVPRRTGSARSPPIDPFRDRVARVVLRVGWRVARAGWWVVRPAHHGALVALRVEGRLLVVRQSYRREWSLPGGGVERGEASRAAAARELGEELGLAVAPARLERALTVRGWWDFRDDTVDIFELRLAQAPPFRLDRREVVAVAFIDPAQPPARTTGPLRAYLDWLSAVPAAVADT